MPSIPCRPLRDGECWKIIRNAGQAAADAKALLIDGVYLHGHEGYLLEQMTNTAFNRRRFGRFADWQALRHGAGETHTPARVVTATRSCTASTSPWR